MIDLERLCLTPLTAEQHPLRAQLDKALDDAAAALLDAVWPDYIAAKEQFKQRPEGIDECIPQAFWPGLVAIRRIALPLTDAIQRAAHALDDADLKRVRFEAKGTDIDFTLLQLLQAGQELTADHAALILDPRKFDRAYLRHLRVAIVQLRRGLLAELTPACPEQALEQEQLPGINLPSTCTVPLSARMIAGLVGQSPDGVESYLRRHRDAHPDWVVPNETRRRNEPTYLYRPALVVPVLQSRPLIDR